MHLSLSRWSRNGHYFFFVIFGLNNEITAARTRREDRCSKCPATPAVTGRRDQRSGLVSGVHVFFIHTARRRKKEHRNNNNNEIKQVVFNQIKFGARAHTQTRLLGQSCISLLLARMHKASHGQIWSLDTDCSCGRTKFSNYRINVWLPVWMYVCFFISDFWWNRFPQYWQGYGRVSLWINKCVDNVLDLLNVLPHCLHCNWEERVKKNGVWNLVNVVYDIENY